MALVPLLLTCAEQAWNYFPPDTAELTLHKPIQPSQPPSQPAPGYPEVGSIERELRDTFNTLDKDGNGLITPNELDQIKSDFASKLSDDHLAAIARAVDAGVTIMADIICRSVHRAATASHYMPAP